MFGVRRKYCVNVSCDENGESSTYDLSLPREWSCTGSCESFSVTVVTPLLPAITIYVYILVPYKRWSSGFRAKRDMIKT